MKKISIIKKATVFLVMMIVTMNTNSANKKTNVATNKEIVTPGTNASGENSVCNEYIPHDTISYEYIYAGMPVVYNCY